jgi:hypothetical protein
LSCSKRCYSQQQQPSAACQLLLASSKQQQQHTSTLFETLNNRTLHPLQGVDSKQLWDKLCPTVGIGDVPRLKVNQNTATGAVPNYDATANWSALSCTALFSHLLNGFAGEKQHVEALHKPPVTAAHRQQK